MSVALSIRFRLGTYQARVIDFNRHGITIETNHRIPVHKQLFVTLKHAVVHSESIIATAHNCRATKAGTFRCGIRFRTDSQLQLDRNEVETGLRALEAALMAADSTTAT